MKYFLRGLRLFFYFIAALIVLVVVANLWIVASTADNVYTDHEKIANNDVALVLGTSHLLTDGSPNPFFNGRMEMAALLYKEGKIRHFIVSGDNRTRYYNEPAEMKKALQKLGIPASSITLDYAGLRTLDSIVRCKEIFGQDHITIVTQNFHSYRALFISDYYGIDAIAYVPQSVPSSEPKMIQWREYLARAKAVLDLYILKTNPRHLGEKEPIQL